ncbi:MAG TPA: nucleotidyltransferase family protein [Solirubrobacterales bacterium]|nr:nucleotidyltransferase family protein [Solirubrobacterales bacterium]
MTVGPEPSAALRLAAFSFSVDRVTAEATRALADASIPSVLIKGPAIAGWLYAGDESRLYGDTDLLLRESDREGAARALRRLGFEDERAPLDHPRMGSAAGRAWVRAADGAAVDLHSTLFGIGAAPGAVWAAFSTGALRRRVSGVEVAMPPYPARLLHVCLHAVQHGGERTAKPMFDLQRALTTVPEETWRQASQLAERLSATEAFAAGLRLLPEGARLATALGVGAGGSVQSALRINWVPTAEGYQQLAEAEGTRAKLAVLARELVPSAAFMRWWTPLARRGGLGLGAAYLWRWAWLAYRAVPGFLVWRRARSGAS